MSECTTEITDLRNYLNDCHLNTNPHESLRGYIDGTISYDNGMPLNPTPDEIVVFREKPSLKIRKKQLTINLLGLEGGRPYVNARLSMYSAESQIDLYGGTRPDGVRSTGRLQQTHSFPYLGRINMKINQHVFGDGPKREGGDEGVIKDITRDGKSVNDVMRELSSMYFACKWCWLMVDAPPAKSEDEEYTVQEIEDNKVRPYWSVVSPLNVLDWYFDATGRLVWIKTQEWEYDDSQADTLKEPKRVIKLWEAGKVTKYTIDSSADRRYRTGQRLSINKEEIPMLDSKGAPMKVVPFILVGQADAKPHTFDDLESINRTIMDLGSVDRASFFNSNYAQLVLPKSIMQTMAQDNYASVAEDIGRLIVGYKYPIMAEKDDVDPKYLMPPSANLTAGSERVTQLKKELFEVVGLSLETDSRQVASAEAKAWDFQDVAAVMKERAELLEDVETKAIAISEAWDPDFDAWNVTYNRDFDIGNFKDEMSTLIMAGNSPLPLSVQRLIVELIVERLDRLGTPITDEKKEEIQLEIASWNPDGAIASILDPQEGAPEEGAPEAGLGAEPQKQALNGAQVTSLVDISKSVASKELSRDAAIAIIINAFPIDKATAASIIDSEGTNLPNPEA